MNKDTRPLSPHLQVYKWPVTMLTSILHRITGVGSALGLILITIWLAFTASGEMGWHQINGFFGNALIVFILFLWSAALIYHLCNGIRHLAWDIGKGFEKAAAKKSAYVVFIATGVITVALWVAIWAVL